ncbi:hypothetical protein RE6C_01381 [Rhodopirellula europaea 6C]|uniref:Uncharacterized protein n=1 Tax=Rhodopirellula europaea 6C TaxID=1263867 RepID=M2ALD1_9BACT|nr:hypothetical protein RE6C_01381 [Rhodopirellula europaea 6C]
MVARRLVHLRLAHLNGSQKIPGTKTCAEDVVMFAELWQDGQSSLGDL